jgi:RHS repeat-associated protein
MESVGPASARVSDMRDPDTLAVVSETWTDYDGDEYYADWELVGGVPTETVQYLAGVFQMVPGGTPEYYHGNQIGTTRLMTGFGDPWPVVTREAVHTAFGELKWVASGSSTTRYGYAGAWGYEEGLMPQYGSSARFPYLHVGARWYDPLTGRFLQRDPIGIEGGLNVYAYVLGKPLAQIDPSGHGLGKWIFTGDWNASDEAYDVAVCTFWYNPDPGPVVAAAVGGGVGAVYGTAKGAIVGAAAGSVAGGVRAGPGAVAGGIAGGLIGLVEGMYLGVLTYYIGDAIIN